MDPPASKLTEFKSPYLLHMRPPRDRLGTSSINPIRDKINRLYEDLLSKKRLSFAFLRQYHREADTATREQLEILRYQFSRFSKKYAQIETAFDSAYSELTRLEDRISRQRMQQQLPQQTTTIQYILDAQWELRKQRRIVYDNYAQLIRAEKSIRERLQ